MRISERYGLGRTQPSLEFVDADIHGDTRVFIDPRAIESLDSDWSRECVSLLHSFFDTVMQSIRSGDAARAQQLLASLSEPNETHLGLSRARAQGHGMGAHLAVDMRNALSRSRAVTSGLIEDLEDTALFVPGIGHDIISDITTNIIRSQLITFTHDACTYYGIPLIPDVQVGRLWNRHSRRWIQRLEPMPVTENGPLLLVPKSIVRRTQTFNPGDYYNNYVLPQLQEDELRAPQSSLVEVLRNGVRRVTKKAVKERYGQGKGVSLETTLQHPDLLDRYRTERGRRVQPLSHAEIADVTGSEPPDLAALLAAVRAVPTGPDHANDYHLAVEALLTALFYPALDQPQREFKIHEGRKRIDIRYSNIATRGFFDWVNRVQQAPAPNVYVECKNYGGALGNPDLDQIAGRFSPLRGRLGLLVHRGYGDKALVDRRCRDTALDGRGFILALDDDDLAELVDERIQNPDSTAFRLLRRKFDALV